MSPTLYRILSLILICSAMWAADATLYPPEVQSALAEYDQKVSKAKADLIGKLQKAQESATKKGNLDLAVAVKAKISEYGTDEPVKAAPGDPSAMVGRWSMTGAGNGAVWTVKAKGQVHSGEGVDGTYKTKDGKLVIEWNNSLIETMLIVSKDEADTSGTSGRGADLHFHRLPAAP